MVERRNLMQTPMCKVRNLNETKQIQVTNKHKFMKFQIGRYAPVNDVNERKKYWTSFKVNLIVDHKLNELRFLFGRKKGIFELNSKILILPVHCRKRDY